MRIVYKNRTLKKVCTEAHEAEKKHGRNMAKKIHQRIDELSAAESIEMLIQYKIGGCHTLKGSRKNQYAMKLVQPYRLVFVKEGSEIQIIRITNIIDYH